MMWNRATLIGIAATATMALAPRMAMGQHAGDFLIGRTAAGQLVLRGLPSSSIMLNAVAGPLLYGWDASDPGFDVPLVDTPAEDFYRIASGAKIWLEVISIDTGLKIWNAGLASLADAPGERIYLGGSSLHKHLIWHIDSTVEQIGPTWEGSLSVRVRLVDTGGTCYTASEPCLLRFANTLAIPGDINGDGYVNVGDLQVLVAAWASQAGPPASENWNSQADINDDGYVNVGDLQVLVAHWGGS